MTSGKLFLQLLCGLTALALLTDCGGGSTSTSTLASIGVSVSPAIASLGGGGTQSFTATVANDSSNGGVTFSIGSGVGALSASTSTSVTYTAPSVVSAATTVTLTVTSKTDTTKSASAAITLTSPSSSSGIAITTLSSTSPTPLAALQIGTTGIDASNAVTLTFSNSSGFSATEQAVRVQSNGTVIAGVPLYVDPSTGQIGQGTVALVLTQGTQSSASTSLTIQDLPPLSTYGTTLGQISHSFLIFEALLHARRLNEFQAAQPLVGTSVNTSSAQSVMQDLINTSNLARTDVDSIMSNNGTVFSWGSLNGTNVQFDSTQLDTMDRIIAVYLTQQFLSSNGASISSSGRLSRGKSSIHPALSISSMAGLLTCLGSNSGPCFMQAQEAVQSSSNPTDKSTAWLTAAKATLKLGRAGQDAALPGLALGFVHLSTALDSLTHGISDAAECLGSLDGCDTAAQQAIQSELNGAGAGIVSSVTQTISQVPVLLGLQLEGQTAGIIDNGFGSVTKIMADSSSGRIAAADTTDVSLVSSSTLPQLSGNLGYVTGAAANTASQGTYSPQNSLALCCFGASQLGITALADLGGNYDLLVPVGVAGTNYSNLSLSEDDTATSTILGTETVDLSGLSTTATVTVPTLNPPTTLPDPGTYTGTCSAQASSITCCTGGVCTTVPAPAPITEPFDFTLASGTSLSQFTSSECATADAGLTAAGCASSSCSFSASTGTSATFSLSCSVPAVAGCTIETVTETCTATQ